MRTVTCFFSFGLLTAAFAHAQCPAGEITLASQAAVDGFAQAYPGCTVLPAEASVTVTGNDITNLAGLGVLVEAEGSLEIRNNPVLASLDGLQLSRAGAELSVRSNPLLLSLDGLESLAEVGGELTIRSNNSLTDISALSGLASVGDGIVIRQNPLLVSLDGLQSLSTVGGILEITGNALLSDINALSGVTILTGGDEGALVIEGNPVLSTIAGFGNDATVITGDVIIQDNALLSACEAMSICKHLDQATDGTATITANATGCDSVAEVQAACGALGIGSWDVLEAAFYPNPATGYFVGSNPHGEAIVLQLVDTTGRVIRNWMLPQGNRMFDTTGIAPGLYVLAYERGGMKKSERLVVR